eukprot:gb/GECH01013695.1/.p1 GENE.gb/GECH01013695.1/~~gb/GECH01013695.1/.p1  ORF type:complete len:215 (+),score=74.26 gb/GECH01013695.1/:1-645(+)
MKLKARNKIGEEQLEQIKKLFHSYDKDHSGNISVDELSDLLNDAGYSFRESTIDMIMDLIDQDESGTVGFDEFVNLVEFLTLVQRRFKEIDKNNNKYIDRKELGAVMSHIGFEFEGTTDVFMRMVDADNSGTIDYEEFFDFAVFVQLLYVMFEVTEKTNKSVLSPSELSELLQALDMPVSSDEAAQIVDQLDTKKKGGLSFEEWVRLVFILRFA